MRVLEFYSGIGGLHCALKESGIEAEVVAAFDLNERANEVYAFNHKLKPLDKNLCATTSRYLDDLKPDIFLMSPPCQPYTRQGKQLGSEDKRASSFRHLISQLADMRHRPSFILVENVKGFEVSETRQELVETLRGLGYHVREFLLSPMNYGIPNSRLRYYLLARSTCAFDDALSKDEVICTNIPPGTDVSGIKRTVGEYLETDDDAFFASFFVPVDLVQKYGIALVRTWSNRSCCFTKNYKRFLRGTGSVLQTKTTYEKEDLDERPELIVECGLRFFTPREIENLQMFPRHFGFPDTISVNQQYKLLGNSVNVFVVASLIQHLVQ